MQIELWQVVVGIVAYLIIGHLLAPMTFKGLFKYDPIRSNKARIMIFESLALLWGPILAVIVPLFVIMLVFWIAFGIIDAVISPPFYAFYDYVIKDPVED